MTATQLLQKQHEEVRGLFKRIEDTEDSAQKRQLFEELATNLVAHDAIEREIFYPACEKAMGMDDVLGEALVEHGVVEFCLFCADEAKEDDFDYKCEVLREMLDHHIDEEEDELFPKVEKALGAEQLESLGDAMQRRFDKAKQADFRAPLHDNLKQVLSGAIKPKPGATRRVAPAATARSRKSAKKPAAALKGRTANSKRNGMHRRPASSR